MKETLRAPETKDLCTQELESALFLSQQGKAATWFSDT